MDRVTVPSIPGSRRNPYTRAYVDWHTQDAWIPGRRGNDGYAEE